MFFYELKSLYLIIQFFSEVLQNKLQSNGIDDKKSISETKALSMDRILPAPHVNSANNYFGKLVEILAKRYKRAPLFPIGFPFPGPPGGYPHPPYPGEYAYPPGYGYGYRPYPPTYDDYMLDNKKRIKSLEKYQSLGYMNSNKLTQMITAVLTDFLGASTIGQYHGSEPLNTTMTRPVIWLRNKIAGVAWTTTEQTLWRPPQWSPAVWQRRR